MDRSNTMNLISVTITTDDIEQNVATESTKQVFCDIRSIDGNEFLRAGQLGIQARYRVTMFKFDYSGESIVEIDGARYGVYRTYEGRDDTIDLYVERKAGLMPEEPEPEPEPAPTPTPDPDEDDEDLEDEP